MAHKSELVNVSVSWKDVERAFVEENVSKPIIKFVRYDERNKMDVYRDEITSKEVKVSTERKIVACPICSNRESVYDSLARDVSRMKPANKTQELEYWERRKDEYKKHLKECEGCRGVVGSGTADYNGTTHTHICEDCGLRYPKDKGSVYSGPYADDSLIRKA